MHIHYNHHFLLDKERDKPDCRLRLRIRYEGQTVAFSVGFRINPERWSLEAQRCTAGSYHGKRKVSALRINTRLQELEQIVTDMFREYEQKGCLPEIEEFREEFNKRQGKDTSERKIDLFSAFDDFVKSEGKARQWTKASYQKFATLRRHLYEYDSKLDFDKLNMEGLNELLFYFRDVCGERNSTILKRVGFIKWFLRWADAHEYPVHPAYKGFSPRLKNAEKTVIFLDWDELMQTYECELPPHLERVRDVFCFCCFTSLRYSDVAKLKRSHVYKDHIRVVTKKTNDSLKIELNQYSRAILDKYKGVEFDDELALPIISNQKMNDHLKEIGRIAGLDSPVTLTYFKANERYDETYPKHELLTTHAGRRTFICNALMFGIAPDIVMKWTGHSDYNAMKPYIAIADKAKANAMSLFNR